MFSKATHRSQNPFNSAANMADEQAGDWLVMGQG